MTMKKKIVIVALVVCIFAMSIASATLAYFTDTEGVNNTFTVGDVDITLTEAGTSNVVNDVTTYVYGDLFPGQNYTVAPTITNIAKDEAYVAGKIVITGINDLFADEAAVKAFLSGGVLNEASGYATKIVFDNSAADVKDDTITVYIIANNPIAKDEEVTLFGDLVIPANWDHAQMDLFVDRPCTITVTAYATQTVGFATAEAAIEAAFGNTDTATNNEFAGYFVTNP